MMSEWKNVKLGQICTFENGDRSSNYPTENDYVVSGGWPFINAGNLKGNRVSLKGIKYISDAALARLTSGKFKANDIVFCLRGSLGKFGMVQNGLSGAIASSLVIIRPNDEVQDKYLYYYFASNQAPKMIERLSGGAAQPNLGVKDLKEFEILLPPVTEQRKIIEVLQTWDEYLENLDKKIHAKKNIQKGLMHDLLSGNLRLSGFNDNWQSVKLGDISHIKTGKKDNQNKVKDGRFPFFVRSPIIERIDTYSYDGEAILVPGEGNIGKIFHYINGKFDFHQRVYKISDFDGKANVKYIHYYFMQYFAKEVSSGSVKATVDSLRLPTFTNFKVNLPTKAEQDAIVNILQTLDGEIEFLQKKQTYLAEQRTYLINNLVSGKIRTPENLAPIEEMQYA